MTISPQIYLSFLVLLSIVSLNVLYYEKIEKLTKHESDEFRPSGNTYNALFFGGIFVVLLFRRTMKDARYVRFLSEKEQGLKEGFSTNEVKTREMLLTSRSLKLLKIKYRRKNFAIRKIFHIFVGI